MSDKNEIIFERFRKLVDKSGLSRQEIADSVGCELSLITKHYNKRRSITSDFIIKYAEFFNVSADYLLGLSDVPTTDIDLKAVCDYTGLSEKAVESIKYVFKTCKIEDTDDNRAFKYFGSVGKLLVDKFLSNELFSLYKISTSYGFNLGQCVGTLTALIEIEEKLQGKNVIPNPKNNKYYQQYKEYKQALVLSLFDSQEMCRDLFDESFETDIKKLKKYEHTYESLLMKRGEEDGNS